MVWSVFLRLADSIRLILHITIAVNNGIKLVMVSDEDGGVIAEDIFPGPKMDHLGLIWTPS